MKNILFIILISLWGRAYAQKMPDAGFYKVHINENDKTILAGISPVDDDVHVKPDLFYYWYSANAIHSTQGGFSGQLLNGQYSEYYLNKNLKQQGFFKNGLKSGVWKTWNEDGTLKATSTWEKGRLVPNGTGSFWGKLDVFKWKIRWHHTDTLKKPNR